MTYQGVVQNGVILVAEGVCLPEGAEVQIELAKGNSPPSEKTEEPTAGQKLAALGRWAEMQDTDLPEDLATNLDHYLYGTPKHP